MKKVNLTLILLLLLTTTVLAQGIGSDKNTSEKIRNDVQNITNNIKEKTDTTFQKEIEINNFTKTILGQENNTIQLTILIVLLATFGVILLLIESSLQLAPFMNEGWKKWVGATLITIIISITGTLRYLTEFYFNLGQSFDWIAKLGPLSIFIGILLALLILWIGRKILHLLEEKIALGKAEHGGKALALLEKKAKIEEEISKELENK